MEAHGCAVVVLGTLFGALGIFFPYYSLYLKEDLGLTGQQVEMAMGLFHLTGLIGQPAWGYIATSQRLTQVGVNPLDWDGAWFCGVLVRGKIRHSLLVSAGFAAFSTSLIPQGMALGLGLCIAQTTRTSSGCGRSARSDSW